MSSILPTVKIASDETEQGYVIINESDFDADTMALFEDGVEALPSTRALPDVLAGMTDGDAITAMAARDERKSAAPLYAARLAALAAK